MPLVASPRSTDARIPLTSNEKGAVGLAFLYWLAYENVFFFYSSEIGGTPFAALTQLIKLALPLALLAYTGLPPIKFFTHGRISLYVLAFVVFLGWSAVPTLLGGNLMEWFKLLPRFVWFLSVVSLFARRPHTFRLFAKCVIVYVALALAQFVLVYLTRSYDTATMYPFGLAAGPFGLFGNVTSMMFFGGIPYPFLRLCGWWNEPSNASASAYAAYFLSLYLYETGEGKRWKHFSTICLIAGLMTFSNAGYLALACALLAGVVFRSGKFTMRRAVNLAVVLTVASAFVALVVVGRRYVAENLGANVFARVITGARDVQDDFDLTYGRLDLLKKTAATVQGSIIGVGIQAVGSEGIESSASAPLYWLLLTGVPGLLLLLSREAALLTAARAAVSRHPATLRVGQAMVAVMAQQAVYGSWMNPNYLIYAAFMLVAATGVVAWSTDPRLQVA